MTFHTAEFQSEFDAYRAWAATVVEPAEPTDEVEPDVAPDPAFADMPVEARNALLDDLAREAAEHERDMLALHAWCDSNR